MIKIYITLPERCLNVSARFRKYQYRIYPFPTGSSPSANFQRSSRTRETRASGAPWVSKSTHPRKFGNHVTHTNRTNDCSSAPQGNQCLLTLPSQFGSPGKKLIAHQCCDQLTTVKTGHPLTSITWPYRGLRCRPMEVKYFLKLSDDKLLVLKESHAQVYFF